LRPVQEDHAAVLRPVGDRSDDRCPGVLSLHEAADGLLVRVRLPGGRLSPVALRAIARLAGQLGNEIIELTSRASLQVRGLAARDIAAVAGRLRAAGLLPSPAHDRVRNVLASPLAGRLPSSRAATDDVVAALDHGLCADAGLAALPGRFLFGVDDGGAVFAGPRCDVALVAEGAGAFRLSLAGCATTLTGTGACLALDAARAFLVLRGDGAAWRVAELPHGAARIARALGGELLDDGALVPIDRVTLAPGAVSQRDGRIAITALPRLGRLDSATAARLAALGEWRLSPARTLSLLDVPPAAVAGMLDRLAALGLAVTPGSGWEGLTACAGLGACARARTDVRAIAERRAGERGPDSPPEHWAACERGCGRPAGALLGDCA
jgi:sulfite reductase beta subunit-like hemoprotein